MYLIYLSTDRLTNARFIIIGQRVSKQEVVSFLLNRRQVALAVRVTSSRHAYVPVATVRRIVGTHRSGRVTLDTFGASGQMDSLFMVSSRQRGQCSM